MYFITHAEFLKRKRHWATMPDRWIKRPEPGVREWWAVGVCRLRVKRCHDGWEITADRGMRGYPPKPSEVGKIAFTYASTVLTTVSPSSSAAIPLPMKFASK